MNRHARLHTAMAAIAIAGLSVCGAAQADDSGTKMKDPLPDSFTLAGVTLYGTIDVGVAYQSEGVPVSNTLPGGLEYQAFTTTRNFAGSQTTVAESGLEQSKFGIRADIPTGLGFNVVGTLETGFNPLSAQLTDACESLAQNSTLPQGKQTGNADSSRCGQFFNSQAFGGVSNHDFGTLTVGRHNSLQLSALAVYDPQALSYAFSFLGYSGFDGGSGSTQGARWDNSAKYVYSNGPIHIGAMFSNGAVDSGLFGQAFGAQVGVAMAGLSVDAVYQHEDGVVNLRSSFDNGGIDPVPAPGLAAYISNDESWNIMGKYTIDLGSGMMDSNGKPAPSDKVMIYAGYSHITKAHSSATAGDAQGGYPISVGININTSAEYSLEWAGVRYAMTSGWTVSAAYYHASQNSWTINVNPAGPDDVGCAGAGLLCSGTFDEVSAVADYAFNKHYDLYGGVNYSRVQDGLASGFVGTPGANATTGSEDQLTVMFGARLRF
jgi:predicted porin